MPNQANFNLSYNTNTISSNISFSHLANTPLTPFDSAGELRTSFIDKSLSPSLLSPRSFISVSHPAVLSSTLPSTNSLDYDSTTTAQRNQNVFEGDQLTHKINLKQTPVSDVFIGSREKTPRAINSAY